MLTPTEKKVAKYLLTLAGDMLGRNGCNDLDLVKEVHLTPQESLEFRALMIKAGDYPDDPVRPDNHQVMDWEALSYLQKRICD